MSFSYTLPPFPPASQGNASRAALVGQIDAAFGRDIWLDLANPGPDREPYVPPTQSGDVLLIEGREALRQAVIRRIITDPGEWSTLPEYGIGASRYVRGKANAATIDELKARIRTQLLRDPRIYSVDQVATEVSDGGLKIFIRITPKGERRTDGARLDVDITIV